jgi:DNA-binding NtrC family response regulator
LDKKQLVVENTILKKKVSKNYEIIGESEAINHIKLLIEKVAPTEARVLITGPNGTGKELVAHQLHEKSERANFPLVEVNCAAIPSELIESELFGHVKGAFTSAVKDRAGKFEAADKGTIFLDEIGDMSLSAQAKVLRALQENVITRVGAEGRFREDLYHRLAVILIKVPELNERREDIPMLVTHFAEKIASEQGTAVKSFSKKAIQLLQEYDWTGNIRELRNVVERLIILGENEISEQDVTLFASK